MVVTKYAGIIALLLLFCMAIKSSHSQRAYDNGDWIPLISSCPTCQPEELSENRKIVKKEATGRVLNIGQDDHPNHFVNNNDKFIPYSGDQNFRLSEADSYEDFQNYYNFNKPIQRQQGSLRDTDSYVEETSKRQQLLAQKALEPLFLNQELQPPKSVAVDSQEQTNNFQTSSSKEQSYQNSPQFNQYSNNRLQTSNAGDNIPPVRFNLLQSNIQSTQQSLETPNLKNNQKYSEVTDNKESKMSNNQHSQYSSERHNYSSPPFINSPTFPTTDKNFKENRSLGTIQFNTKPPSNQNGELSNIPNPSASTAKESDIRSQTEGVALPLHNRFSEDPDIPYLRSLSDSDVNPNFSPPQIRNVIQDVNAGLQPELPRIDKATPPLYQEAVASRAYTNRGSESIHITTLPPSHQPNKQGVELLYVPVQYLDKHQEQQRHFSNLEDTTRSSFPRNQQSGVLDEPTSNFQKTSAQPFKQVQQIEGIQNDFASQALGALKLQQQLYSGEIPITSPPVNNFISTTTKSVKKKKSHQPPLAVYMESDGNVKVTDVLNLLKHSRTISVQDTVGPDTPPVFVGPYDLDSPEGYAKFDLPYLSSLDANQIVTKADEFPFFVAPINYRAPEGYSKIPLPSPHVGSIVLSEKNNDKGSFAKSPQNAFAGVPSRDIPEHKQHYRDTLDQPNYQTKPLLSNVETPLSIRQTTDHNDYNQLNNHFLHPNQRIPSPQSKFEEEYNRINNIYRTSPKPEISQFVITTSTPSPLRDQQQYVFNPQTGFVEQIPHTQSFIDQQHPVQGNRALVRQRGELTHLSPPRDTPPTRDIIEHQQAPTKPQENVHSRSRLADTQRHNVDISTTLKPSRGRFRETSDQISTKPARDRGSSHFSSSSYDQGEKHDLERPKSVQRSRGNNSNRNRISTARTKEESNQQWQKHVDESSPSSPTILGSRSTSPSGIIYNDESQTHTNNLSPSDKILSTTHNSINSAQVPYYEEISDIQPINQQVPSSVSLKDREEAKKQRTQSVSSLEQNLGIPITSNGASGILSQSAGDDSYSDPLLKSTEEPVFEFTTRSQPTRSRPSTFESYELDSTHSDESRDFDDFFLTSSEHEEEPKNFRLSPQVHSVNPALPGLINNLQDQSIRSILNPALIAPTTQQSIDEITSSQRIKLPHTETNINTQNSFLKPQQNYQTPQAPPRVTENYEMNTQQQKHTIMADNRRNPIHMEPHKLEMERPAALPTNEQQNFNNLQPSGSFSLAPPSFPTPSLQSIDSSTHLPTIETTTITKRGRGRFRSRGPSVSTTTTASTRRNYHRTRRPLKVEPRSESLDHHQTASSTYSPVKSSDTISVNGRYKTNNNLGGLYHKNIPQEKSEYYQKVQVIPEYERMPNNSSNQFDRQTVPINTFYTQPSLNEYASDTTNSAPINFIQSSRAMSTLPLYRQENVNVDLSSSQPIMFNRDVQNQDVMHFTSPSANAAEQTQSHSSNVQFIHPDDYSNATFINFIPRSNSQLSTEVNNVNVQMDNLGGNSQYLNYDTAPSAEATISETTETTTGQNTERGRTRGRASVRQHISSTVPVTERYKATTLENPKEDNEEIYGFFRSPNFNAVTPSSSAPTSHANMNPLSVTHSVDSQIVDSGVPYSSTQKSPETVRPRYSSVIRNPTGIDKEYETSTTTKQTESTQRSRKRGRTRRPLANSPSTTRTNEQTETIFTRRYTTTERPSIRTTQKTQRLRTRGRVHFQPPQSLKEKREDDLETANYPASFLASQGIGMKQSATRSIAQTENPNFQITVESGFDTNENLGEYDQLTNPSYISTSIVMPDGRPNLLNQIDSGVLEKISVGPLTNSTSIEPYVVNNTNENVQNATDSINSDKPTESIGTKKRGFWKLVKQKTLSDPLEAAESQNVGSFSANSFAIAEEKPTKKTEEKSADIENIPQLTEEDKTTDDLDPDVYEATTEYDLSANSNLASEFNNTLPDNSDAKSESLATTENESQNSHLEQKFKPSLSTEIPPKTTNSFEKSMRTLQSTEISHETEICYRGKCIRTSNPSL